MATTVHPDVTERRQTPDRRLAAAQVADTASRLRTADWFALALLVIGGLDLGAAGLFGVDPVAALFSEGSVLARTLQLLIGGCAVYATLYTANKLARRHG